MVQALRVQQIAPKRCVAARAAKRSDHDRGSPLVAARGAAIGITSALILLSNGGAASAAAKLSVQDQQKAVDEQVSSLSDLLEKQREKTVGTVCLLTCENSLRQRIWC